MEWYPDKNITHYFTLQKLLSRSKEGERVRVFLISIILLICHLLLMDFLQELNRESIQDVLEVQWFKEIRIISTFFIIYLQDNGSPSHVTHGRPDLFPAPAPKFQPWPMLACCNCLIVNTPSKSYHDHMSKSNVEGRRNMGLGGELMIKPKRWTFSIVGLKIRKG